MAQSELKNTPPLYGWVIATGMGAVAFGVSLLLVGIEGNGSVAIGAVVALVVGTIFTIAENPAPPPRDPATLRSAAAPTKAPARAPVVAPASTSPATAVTVDDTPDTSLAEAVQPSGLDAPEGSPDDLKQITGVGPVMEQKLNGLGIFHFRQIASWSEAEVAWVDEFLNSKGRIARDNWIEQAAKLAQSSTVNPPS